MKSFSIRRWRRLRNHVHVGVGLGSIYTSSTASAAAFSSPHSDRSRVGAMADEQTRCVVGLLLLLLLLLSRQICRYHPAAVKKEAWKMKWCKTMMKIKEDDNIWPATLTCLYSFILSDFNRTREGLKIDSTYLLLGLFARREPNRRTIDRSTKTFRCSIRSRKLPRLSY